MKRTPLLNRHLSALIATLGHGDRIVLADAGLPIPPGVPVIDLAVVAGLPTLLDVLNAIKGELMIEAATRATEASPDLSNSIDTALAAWAKDQGREIDRRVIGHEDFKVETGTARAIIRTGEVTPYANLILFSGVAF
ncbi:UNVERIFIED_CONTAM: hypothetical protein GTU68_007810 [Idotea baltica]|nr:hypothetical protein [Idotea baltica]